MSVKENTRWKEWAERLRQRMMAELTTEVALPVERIRTEIKTDKSASAMRTRKFWTAFQAEADTNNVLRKAGFHIDFVPNANGDVEVVTLRLNDTWKSIMQRVLDRRAT
ncbi:MAG TPA: hypothetical protein VFQ26_02260 [Nitrospiraceae bacterium]|nr:hypothetical protein [Nitrospiraceae bacterium]